MNTSASTIVTVNIPQNNLGFLNRGGRYLQIVKAVGPILVKIDSTDEKELLSKQGIHFPDGFDRATFRTPDGHAAQIRVWVGDDEFIDRRVDQKEARSVPVNVCPAGNIPPDGKIDLTGEATGNRDQRKSIIISNMDPAIALELQDADGVSWGIVRAGETISHVTSEFIRIKNPATAAVQVRIAEFWYLL